MIETERRIDIYERSRAAGGTIEKLKLYGRVEAALVRSISGEGATSVMPSGTVALGLHLSAPNVNTFRYVGEGWRDYIERPGTTSLIVPERPFEQMGSKPSEDLHVLLPAHLMRDVGEETGAVPELTEFIPAFSVQDKTLKQLMEALTTEVRDGGPGGRMFAEGLANALAVHVLRHYALLGGKRKRELGADPGAASVSKRGVRQALDFIGDHLSDDVSLADVAQVANLSERHLHRVFKGTVGMSPHQYVIKARIDKAKELLRHTDLTIAEVAVSSGFAHHQHLNRHFKRLTGASPDRFRRELRP